LIQSEIKVVSKFELSETQFEKIVKDKIASKPTWSKKITVLRTFLDSLLNFLSNNLENATKFGKVRDKSGVKFELPESHFEKQ